jgi:hypothetical protein
MSCNSSGDRLVGNGLIPPGCVEVGVVVKKSHIDEDGKRVIDESEIVEVSIVNPKYKRGRSS